MMKKKLLFMCLMFGYVGLLFGQTLNPDQMKSDLGIFKNALEAKHPEMYRYTSEKEFDVLFEKVLSDLNAVMSVREFYVKMSPIVAALHCGHTKWIVAGKDLYYPFFDVDLFPLKLYFENDRAIVLGHFEGHEVPVLAEVTSINGQKMGDIVDDLLGKLSFGDGYSMGGKHYQLNHAFSGIFSTHYGTSSQYDIEIVKNGEPQKLILKGVTFEEIQSYQSEMSKVETPFQFEILEGNTAWMDIDRFYAYPKEPDYKKFLKASFDQIKQNNTENLVIDLRGNEGGNENWGIELYKYLAKKPFAYYDRISVKKIGKTDFESKTSIMFKLASIFNKNGEYGREFTYQKGLKSQKPHKNAFKGNVYLLLDGQSFSVTTEFASRFKSDQRGIIIGNETAGGYAMNSSGFFTIVNLPNSKIDLGIPLLGFHMADLLESNPKDRGVIPDHIIELNAENILKGKDPVKDFTFGLINQPKTIKATDKP